MCRVRGWNRAGRGRLSPATPRRGRMGHSATWGPGKFPRADKVDWGQGHLLRPAHCDGPPAGLSGRRFRVSCTPRRIPPWCEGRGAQTPPTGRAPILRQGGRRAKVKIGLPRLANLDPGVGNLELPAQERDQPRPRNWIGYPQVDSSVFCSCFCVSLARGSNQHATEPRHSRHPQNNRLCFVSATSHGPRPLTASFSGYVFCQENVRRARTGGSGGSAGPQTGEPAPS